MVQRVALFIIKFLLRYCPDYHIRKNPVRKKGEENGRIGEV
jgi:hypothetical protein